VHSQSFSIVHELLQPSLSCIFPSSHSFSFELKRTPSPQISVQVSGVVELPPDQVQLASTEQVLTMNALNMGYSESICLANKEDWILSIVLIGTALFWELDKGI
jgi:hypothetical protein